MSTPEDLYAKLKWSSLKGRKRMTQPGLGQRTAEFMVRRERNRKKLPEILIRLSDLLAEHIQEIEQPKAEDITFLLHLMNFEIGSRDTLRLACGSEGQRCKICPFGAFIPPEFEFSSETRAICLPWIAMVGYNALT